MPGPVWDLKGTYNFLSLVSGLVIKRCKFDKLPAPDSVITCVAALASKSRVSKSLVFADRHRVPYNWPDNTDNVDGLDPTPIAAYPDIPAEMLGVILKNHTPSKDAPLSLQQGEPDWSQLADEAAVKTDLDVVDHLPPPPEVIEIDDDDDCVIIPPQTAPVLPQVEIFPPTPTPTLSPCYPTREQRQPRHLGKYHLFTTVAHEQLQPPLYPYHTAGCTDVDLAIQDKIMIAQVCRYTMVHMANILYLSRSKT
jgi:hypothetical protein